MREHKDIQFKSETKDVFLARMRVSPVAQRTLRQYRVDELHSVFDPEFFGLPVLSFREGHYWIVDGQHRIEAAKKFLGVDWEKQVVTCRVYSGMTEKDEAEMYLRLNNQLSQHAFERFKVAVTAKRPTETAVKKAVEKAGLRISLEKDDGCVSAVTTLVRIYSRSDEQTLERALRIVNESFGAPGLTNSVIDGTARVCERYNGTLPDKVAIDRLHSMRGGVGALLTKAGNYRKQTGNQIAYCVAGAIVDTVNAKHGGKKLASWWREEK